MAELEEPYLQLIRDILDHGHKKDDRTKTGTISLFGYQMRFDLGKGFPLLTTKKVPLGLIKSELLWFLNGDTNIQYLLKHKPIGKAWEEEGTKGYNDGTPAAEGSSESFDQKARKHNSFYGMLLREAAWAMAKVDNEALYTFISDFHPDVIIGSVVSTNPTKPKENDLMSQIENMVMQKTDYSIPDSMGILMTFKYDNVNLLQSFPILSKFCTYKPVNSRVSSFVYCMIFLLIK